MRTHRIPKVEPFVGLDQGNQQLLIRLAFRSPSERAIFSAAHNMRSCREFIGADLKQSMISSLVCPWVAADRERVHRFGYPR
jgi:hypothetical protein